MNARRDRLFALYVVPDWRRQEGYELVAILGYFPSLMRANEEGRRLLVGLEVRVRLRWPWGRRDGRRTMIFYNDWRGWRAPIQIELYSDLNTITIRRAALGEAGRGASS